MKKNQKANINKNKLKIPLDPTKNVNLDPQLSSSYDTPKTLTSKKQAVAKKAMKPEINFEKNILTQN